MVLVTQGLLLPNVPWDWGDSCTSVVLQCSQAGDLTRDRERLCGQRVTEAWAN
jgi:hypothetical protein